LHLFILLLFCFASAILGDSTAEALLLANFDSAIIPRMFLFNAAALFVVSAVMMIVIDNVDRGVFFLSGLVLHASLLFVFKVLVELKLTFVYPVLFTYAYTSKILLFMLFWTLANDLVDSRKAGKQFPLIAAGGTLGAVIVSFSIPSIVKTVRAENLLFVWIILVVMAAVLFLPILRRYGVTFKARSERTKRNIVSIVSDLKLFRQEPLLCNMGAVYFLLFFLMLNQHFLFYSQLKKQFVTASAMASFLGYFNGVSMVSTFVLQMTLSGRVLRRFGSARAMLLVPSLFTVFFLTLLIESWMHSTEIVLLSMIIIAGMGLRIAFFDSFFSPNFQIFFSSLPQQIRGRGKLTMEGVIKPCAMVLTGLWLMWVGKQLSLVLQSALLLFVGVVATWKTWRIRNRYAESLTNYLTGFSGVKASGILSAEFNSSPEVIRKLGERLYNEEYEVRKFIIELIASSPLQEATRILVDYFDRGDTRMKSTLLASIHGTNQKELKSLVEKSLSDMDARVVANAVLALAEISGNTLLQYVDNLLNHSSPRVRANMVYTAWRLADESLQKALTGHVYKMLYDHFPNESASALFALGEMDGEKPLQILLNFIKFFKFTLLEFPAVFNQSIYALGKKKDIESADMLLQLAQVCSRKQRTEIVKALGLILPYLPYEQLCALSFATDYAAFNLIVAANHVSGKVIDDAWRKHLRNSAEREIRDTINYMEKYSVVCTLQGPGAELLSYAVLEEHIDLRVDTLVHIASLLDRSGNIRKIVPRLFHSNAHMRARALEVMDNTGDYKLNRRIMNVLEKRITFTKRTDNSTTMNSSGLTTAKEFLDDPNEWVSQCARYLVCNEDGTGGL
jgi:HEAT repeat protein/ATP/ADP translocase